MCPSDAHVPGRHVQPDGCSLHPRPAADNRTASSAARRVQPHVDRDPLARTSKGGIDHHGVHDLWCLAAARRRLARHAEDGCHCATPPSTTGPDGRRFATEKEATASSSKRAEQAPRSSPRARSSILTRSSSRAPRARGLQALLLQVSHRVVTEIPATERQPVQVRRRGDEGVGDLDAARRPVALALVSRSGPHAHRAGRRRL